MDAFLTQTAQLWALGLAVFVALMTMLYLVHLAMRNASVVDFGWGTGIALCAALYAWMGTGEPMRRAAVLVMAGCYGVRLSYHLGRRILGHPEEGRYQQLRRDWGTGFLWKMFWFYQMQALVGTFLTLPLLLPVNNGTAGLHFVEAAGFVVWLTGFLGEALADRQLARFKADPANKGRVFQGGLWRYSRHPNYFFQFVMWLGFAVFALASPYGWTGLISPALMLYFLVYVTGIPPTEAQALRSRGDAYREYQRTTSAFVPWFRKSGAA